MNTVGQITHNPRVPTLLGLTRHLVWQGRKGLRLFPFEQQISSSKIIARHRRCGVSALIHSQGLYDYDNMMFFQLAVSRFKNCFDIGANIGVYTLLASENDAARVFAFEPHPVTFQYLQDNINLNQRSNVQTHNVAVSNESGELRFSNKPGSAINKICDPGEQDSIRVPTVRIDEICAEQNISPNVVKIDVEGFEYNVLKGMGERLSDTDVLFVEIRGYADDHAGGTEGITELIRSKGLIGPFQIDFSNKKLSDAPSTSSHDQVFLSRRATDWLQEIQFHVAA